MRNSNLASGILTHGVKFSMESHTMGMENSGISQKIVARLYANHVN